VLARGFPARSKWRLVQATRGLIESFDLCVPEILGRYSPGDRPTSRVEFVLRGEERRAATKTRSAAGCGFQAPDGFNAFPLACQPAAVHPPRPDPRTPGCANSFALTPSPLTDGPDGPMLPAVPLDRQTWEWLGWNGLPGRQVGISRVCELVDHPIAEGFFQNLPNEAIRVAGEVTLEEPGDSCAAVPCPLPRIPPDPLPAPARDRRRWGADP